MKHEIIWAPWRMAYVTGNSDAAETRVAPPTFCPGADSDCFLCQAAGQPAAASDDRARLVVARNEDVVLLLNRFPYNNGHLLVAPRAHVGRLDTLDDSLHASLMKSICQFVCIYERLIRADGFNIGLNLGREAGAGVPDHLHWHLVPRWNGDHNFMPTIAGTRVVSQALEALWEAVTKELGTA